jgi:hypothetical protein
MKTRVFPFRLGDGSRPAFDLALANEPQRKDGADEAGDGEHVQVQSLAHVIMRA